MEASGLHVPTFGRRLQPLLAGDFVPQNFCALIGVAAKLLVCSRYSRQGTLRHRR